MLFSMIFLTILFVVSFGAGGTSIVIIPEKLQGHGSGYVYHRLKPDAQQAANNDIKIYSNKYFQPLLNEDGFGDYTYRNGKQNLEDNSPRDAVSNAESKRPVENYKEDTTNAARVNDDAQREDYRQGQSSEEHENSVKEDDNKTDKVIREENIDEEKGEESNEEQEERSNLVDDDEKDHEEINEAENDEENEEKNNDNYENYEDHDAFKWPDKNQWRNKFDNYKSFNEFDLDPYGPFGEYANYGKFGNYGKYGSSGKYRSYTRFGCLELGHGEYC